MGLIAGLIFGLTGLFHSDHHALRKAGVRAIVLTVTGAAVLMLIGCGIGMLWPEVEFRLPGVVIHDERSSLAAALMHLESYAGAVLGMSMALVRQVIGISRIRKGRRSDDLKRKGHSGNN
jgi:fucose permease